MSLRFIRFTGVGASIFMAMQMFVASDALAQKTQISIAHLGPPTSAIMKATIIPMLDALKATGSAEITLYSSGSAYSNPRKYSELVEKGVVDMAFGVQQFETGRFPLNLVIGEPFVVDDHEKGTRAYMEVLKKTPALRAEYSPNHLLQVALASAEQIHTRTKPVKSVDDLKGMRILVTNPGVAEIFRTLGANTAALPLPKQYENLQKGVIDASSSSMNSVAAFNLFEVTSHHFEWNIVPTPIYLVMTKKKYDGLRGDLKKVIDDFSTIDAAVKFSSAWTRLDDVARRTIRGRGGKIVKIDPRKRGALKKRFTSLLNARVDKINKKHPGARKIYDEFVKAVAAQQ